MSELACCPCSSPGASRLFTGPKHSRVRDSLSLFEIISEGLGWERGVYPLSRNREPCLLQEVPAVARMAHLACCQPVHEERLCGKGGAMSRASLSEEGLFPMPAAAPNVRPYRPCHEARSLQFSWVMVLEPWATARMFLISLWWPPSLRLSPSSASLSCPPRVPLAMVTFPHRNAPR